MRLLGLVLWAALPHLSVRSAPDLCGVHDNSRPHDESPLLQSLQCHNDYESYIFCRWRARRDAALQLWLHGRTSRKPCVPYRPPGPDGTVRCRVPTTTWAIGIYHTFFFLRNETPAACSSGPRGPVRLSQRLRARPPVDVSTHDAGDGGRWIRWSSPYPTSSPLSHGLAYQLSYRADTRDAWTTQDVQSTSTKLERHLLPPGHRYEAKVRARAGVGQWSGWSAAVTWDPPDDSGHPPRLLCVLDGESEVTCSWELSRELAHLLSYQLTCRHNRTAQPESCCVHPTVGPDLGGTGLRFSCSLNVAEPAHLLLELLPTHNAKTFDPNRHIRPKPPQKVKLREKGSNWVVEWSKPRERLPDLLYEVCYCRTQHQEPYTCENTSSPHHIIRGALLVPSQDYQVRVRSLVEPGEGSRFEGIPSEWTDPMTWTSPAATWSVTYLVYFLIGVFVAALFLVFYCSVPTCRRRVTLWVDSVPSPGKSKILSELQAATGPPLPQSEDTSVCKVLRSDSTCSSHASLWPPQDADADAWTCDEKVKSSSTSSINFSGPYIFCQASGQKSADARREAEVKEDQASSGGSPSPVEVGLFGEGYVCLPATVSRSTQDLVSRCEQDRPRPDGTSVRPDLGGPTVRGQPPAYSSVPPGPCPQGSQASGYCFLPQPK